MTLRPPRAITKMGERGKAPSGLDDDGLLVAVRRRDGAECVVFLVNSVARGLLVSVPDEKWMVGDEHDSER